MDANKMNNEPVAWLWNEDGCNLGVVLDQDKQIGKQEFQDYFIPLYTHPAKTLEPLGEKFEKVLNDNLWELMEESPAKTLTDEEIALVWDEFSALQSPKDIKDFAKAILRKAQNK
jgi:hypothetical protein